MRTSLDYDVVMFALPRWDGPYSSTAFSLAKELSRFTRVFYIDNPITLKEYLVKRNTMAIERRREPLFMGSNFFTVPDPSYENLFAITPRMTLPINFLPHGKLYETISFLNDKILQGSLNRLIRIFGIKRYVFINSFNPLYGRNLTLTVKPLLKIYQSVDDIRYSPYMDRHGPRLENEWVKHSDFTIVTSSELKRLKGACSDKVHLLPNAANVSLFRTAMRENYPVPKELLGIPKEKKVIAYTGNICQRLDYALLKKIAIHHHDKILLMVGPFGKMNYKTSGLSALPNVTFTGPKRLNELPQYLKYVDCCIIPFVCNTLTKSIYPLKINEYLSAGKPVVTTDFSQDIKGFSEIALVSQNETEFIQNIQKAIDEDNEVKRVERMIFSAANNWESRAQHFIELTGEFLK